MSRLKACPDTNHRPRRAGKKLPSFARLDNRGRLAPHLFLPGDSHVAGGASGGGDVAFQGVIHNHAIGVEAPA